MLNTFKETGFDMSYEECKRLCREAWKEKYNYLIINRLEERNIAKYKICIESCGCCKSFIPQTDLFTDIFMIKNLFVFLLKSPVFSPLNT